MTKEKPLSFGDALSIAIVEYRDSKQLNREIILQNKIAAIMRLHVGGAIGRNVKIEDITKGEPYEDVDVVMSTTKYYQLLIQVANQTKQEIRNKFLV